MTTTQTIKSILLGSVAAIAFLGLINGTFANAATYLYVTSGGVLTEVVADSPSEAIAVAPNIAYNSGVMLASQYSDLEDEAPVVTGGDHRYAYVATNGEVKYVMADSPTMAMYLATDIAYNSGVLRTSQFDEDLE